MLQQLQVLKQPRLLLVYAMTVCCWHWLRPRYHGPLINPVVISKLCTVRSPIETFVAAPESFKDRAVRREAT